MVAKSREDERAIDGLQSVVGIVGITLGLIPLARVIFTGELGGLFGWIFGPLAESLGYIAPLGVVVIAVAAIALLEAMKRRA